MVKSKDNKELILVVPTIPGDVKKFLSNLDIYSCMLPINRICIIGNINVKDELPNSEKIIFIAEETLVNFNQIKDCIIKRSGNIESARRTGWYIQQFVKMFYSRQCDSEYYLLWDSDTIPLKKVQLFDANGIPFLDCKTEYHKPYFDTITNLFPVMKKDITDSFIAEHMVINTEIMKRMLDDIEKNEKLTGKSVGEKIINAIEPSELHKSGFSEFETYGTYITKFFPEYVVKRKWKSLRFGGFFYDGEKTLKNEDILWLAKTYDAISFEKRDYTSFWAKIVKKTWYKKIFRANSLEILSLMIRVYRKILGMR